MYHTHRLFKNAARGAPDIEVKPDEPIISNNQLIIILTFSDRIAMYTLECWPSNIKPE